MKQQMMTLSQLPHFLRFSVRTLCLQLFFIVVFISSQTPFSYSDSTLFISEDSYLYVESRVDVSDATSFSETNNIVKKANTTKRKAFFKLYSSTSKNHINPSSQTCFTVPKSSYYVGNSNNSLSTAVLGNSSPVKQHHKIAGSDFWVMQKVVVFERKFIYPLINHINLLKIITNHFSRPPPYLLFLLNTNDTNNLSTNGTNIYARIAQMITQITQNPNAQVTSRSVCHPVGI